jgi:hypothetical protein
MKKLMRLVEEMTPAETQAKKDGIALAQEKIKDATKQFQTAKSPLEKKAAQSALVAAKEDLTQATATQESISEEAGRKYTAEESAAVGKAVGKSLIKVLRAQGDEVVDIRLTGVGLNKFNIKVKYGNDKGHDLFKFDLNPDTESIVLDLGNEPLELIDFVITQGNTVSLPTPELEDKLSDAMKKYISEPTDAEYDDMAAMEPPTDPSQLNKNIAEGILEERTFNINGLGTFEFAGMRDDLVMGSQNNGPVRTFKKEKVLQDNPSFFDRQPRERKPQGVRPYSEAQYREVLQGAIDDAGSTEFAYDIADSMILDPQILARLKKDYPGESAKELKQQLQYDLEACDAPDDDYDDDYEGEVAETVALNEKKATYCGRCGHTHVKGTPCPRPFKNEALDPVGKEDDDINNDGKADSTDKYLAKRRQAISKNINETTNPELTKYVNRFVGGLASKYDYSTQDAVYAIMQVLRSQEWKGVNEDLDVGHQDNEPEMLKKDVYRIAKMASMLYKQLDNYDNGQEVDFPHWWQAKIIKAYDYLQAAYGYLDAEEKVQQMDNTIVATMSLNEKKLGTLKNIIAKKELRDIIVEAYIEVLKEAETQPPALKTSTQEILGKFPTVKKALVSLFTHEFNEFVEDVKWTVPKPSTFKVVLKNGQFIDLKWMGKGFEATVEGKQYFLNNVAQYQQALDALGRLLRDGPITQGEEPGGEDFAAEPPADTTAPPAGGAEAAPADFGAEGGEEAGGPEEETPTAL